MGPGVNYHELFAEHDSTPLERIGQGRCGTVWAARCSDCYGHCHLAIKLEDGSTGRSISHEYKIHQEVLRTSVLCCFFFQIPQALNFLDSQDISMWHRISPKLPEGYTRCNAIVSEKIIPLPASTRRLLVQKLHPDIDEESVMNSSSNEHCLIRPYLGRRRRRNPEADTEPSTRPRAFSLRDFPLHLDQMEQLGLDPGEYAVTMADALAFMHWVARVDGNGVEFVLGRPRGPPYFFCLCHKKSSQDAHPHNISILGPHSMWITDLDMCKELTLDESGIEQACSAFWGNDPWYPRPGRLATADQKLWDTFEHRFLTSSARALGGRPSEIRKLPRLLMEKIKQTAMTTSTDEVGNSEMEAN